MTAIELNCKEPCRFCRVASFPQCVIVNVLSHSFHHHEHPAQ